MVKEFTNKNQWAIVLGGSSGLGLATAKKLAIHGLHICIIHRNARFQMNEIRSHFDEIQRYGVQFLSYNIDAVNIQKRKQTIDNIKANFTEKDSIRVFVHSIAKGNLKPMLTKDSEALQNDDFQITINAMGISLYDWVKDLFDANLFANDARVISFTSEGNSKPWKSYAAVSAAKVTLEAITRSIAIEFSSFGIRANCIQAGVTDTDAFRRIPNSDLIKKHTLQRNPFGRLTTPEDIANVVYLLSKDEASWINGTIIKADGGESLQ